METEIKPLGLFLVAPAGNEEKLAIVAAYDRDDAIQKALHVPSIASLATQGVEMLVLDIPKHLSKSGIIVSVTRSDMFH